MDDLDILSERAKRVNGNAKNLAAFLRKTGLDVSEVTEADLDVDAEIQIGDGTVAVQVCVYGGACVNVWNKERGSMLCGKVVYTFTEVEEEVRKAIRRG